MNSIAITAVLLLSATSDFEPTTAYEVQHIEGWKCFVNKRLKDNEPELCQRATALLQVKLHEIRRVVPASSLKPLQAIPLWVELDDDKHNPCCCYHVSADWLRENGFNPEKERSVEICNAQRFLDWSHDQPWMVLHELAHGLHHREFGYDEPRIVEAWKKAKEAGIYDSVLRYNGRTERHYAIKNQMEYFAEASEAYFGTNDFFPFVRAELKRHDPDGYELIRKMWGADSRK